jgi:predicted anti-sigma-YlaC factor YlaD
MLAQGVLDTHLGRCAACASWAESATQLHRATRIAPAPAVPDLVAPILAAAARGARVAPSFEASFGRVARLALAGIGVAELITAVQGLFGGANAGSTLHAVHELGSFDAALAVGFICVAFRPSLARGMLPLVAALVATLAAVTVADVVSSHTGWAGESAHLLAVIGLPMLWFAGRSADEHGPVPRRPVSVSTGLRVA